MNASNSKCAFGFLSLLLPCVLAQQVFCADSPAGRVVWWGRDLVWQTAYSGHPNGVIASGGEILSNVVAIADGLALKSDGRVFAWGVNYSGSSDAASLSNVVSIMAAGKSYWVVKSDGAMSWSGDERVDAKIVAALSNTTAIIDISRYFNHGVLALKRSGVVLALDFGSLHQPPILPVGLVAVSGKILSNVVAMASMGNTPLVLKNDGTVLCLGHRISPLYPFYTVTIDSGVFEDIVPKASVASAVPFPFAKVLTAGGQVLSNVVAIAGGEQHGLALKNDGTVVAFDINLRQIPVPVGLNNVVAIVTGARHSLALKRDGTVVAWGDNNFGQTSVPAGLSNVMAITAGDRFSLALTTGRIPSSVFIPPHGRLEEMAAKSDLVFKGQVISTEPVTNSALLLEFSYSSAISLPAVRATRFQVISVLKGDVTTNEIVFQHFCDSTTRTNTRGMIFGEDFGGSLSGIAPPPRYNFEVGQSYLVFAAGADKRGRNFSALRGATNMLDRFRPIERAAADESVTRTLDARPLGQLSVKDAHWFELNLLLNDTNPTNQLYAIQHLNRMATTCGESWEHGHDFKRERVLDALRPLFTNVNDQVAVAAIGCFQVASECAKQIVPHTDALIEIATSAPSASRRVAAIAVFSGTKFSVVSNSLPQWLRDPAEDARIQAVRLLLNYPGEFAERALREHADDDTPKVRSAVAEVIGNGKFERALPTLAKLFSDPIGDVHTNAGLALLQFDADQVADILKPNLDDPGFCISFIAKLAEKDAGPWLSNLVRILEQRREQIQEIAKSASLDPRRRDPDNFKNLIGPYAKCWEDIRHYLLTLPKDKFSNRDLGRYMDILEHTLPTVSNTTVPEVRSLYELYKTKGLKGRARAIRRQYKVEREWFDDFDRKHPDL
jgi:hypothetical protein